MKNREYKVYTLWELTIPIKDLKSSSIRESDNILFVYWNGAIKPKRREEKKVDSLAEADRLRRELIPSKEKILDFRRVIQQINNKHSDSDYFVMLHINFLMGVFLDENVLIVRTRQHPSISKIEKSYFNNNHSYTTTLNTDVRWDYKSPLIRKNSSCYQVFCPLCNDWFGGSQYLSTVFKDERSLWLANMVTHYRHSHITSWNKMFGQYGYRYQQAAHYYDEDYEDRKAEINERAKRQIARKSTEFLKDNNINIEVFRSLQGTSEKTIEVVCKLINSV